MEKHQPDHESEYHEYANEYAVFTASPTWPGPGELTVQFRQTPEPWRQRRGWKPGLPPLFGLCFWDIVKLPSILKGN